tara:strand:+ start:1266 stop:1628 length:363 start_codon:yes stop_codon:yes gene_type:complete
MSAHPTVRRLLYRFSATGVASEASNILTVTGVPQKGFIVRTHIVNGSGNITPILTEDSTASSAVKKILEIEPAALEQDEIFIQPIYYEAHDDSGTMKIYLKPVSSTNTTLDYNIDIWPAG